MSRLFPESRPPLSTRLRLMADLAGNSLYDARRFWAASFTGGVRNQENLRARIAIGLHFLEYGLSLRDSAPGHALDKARQLAQDIETYIASFGADATTAIALRTLDSYLAQNAGAGLELDDMHDVLTRHGDTMRDDLSGGSEEVDRAEIRARGMMDFVSFAESRHSIRTYAPDPVPHESIQRAVRAAQQSPSPCNRQTCRARVWTDPAARTRVLALQSGNRGFGDRLGGVAVITSNLAHWEHANERYQGWVDGGMFAMSFAYGLHAEGLGAVMLNWSERRQRDQALRRLIRLPESELVITMIGFGCLPGALRVPVSQRKPLAFALALNQPLAD